MDQEGSSQSPTGQGRSPSAPSNSTAPSRSRWSPKPEQILILESIFNSGIVNPPKDETVRIRKMLLELELKMKKMSLLRLESRKNMYIILILYSVLYMYLYYHTIRSIQVNHRFNLTIMITSLIL